jgi:hypothetical protein
MQQLEWSYKLGSPYVKSLSKGVQRTMRNERAIINAIIKAAKDRGYFLQSFDGDGEASPITKQKALIEPNLYSCDDAYLLILEPSPTKPGKFRKVASFYFIYGNGNDGCDVMSNGSWIDNGERNTEAIYKALDDAGSAVAAKLER